jgi:VWFA-related protein
MKRIVVPFFALTIGCGAAASAAQQLPFDPWVLSPDSSQMGPGMNPSEGRIAIDVSVTDAKGDAATDLGLGDFKLLDEGQPVSLATFASSSASGPAPGDPPVSVIVVLDEADMFSENIKQAESDIELFLRSNGGRLAHAATLYRVTPDKLYASAEPTLDGNQLADQIASGLHMRPVWKTQHVEVLRGPADEIEISNQPFANPVLPHVGFAPVQLPLAMKALGAIAIEQRRVPGRKLLFWIGPGWRVDLKANKDLFEAITEFSMRLREARIEISIANNWPDKENPRFILSNEQVLQYASGVRFAQDSNYDNLALQVLALRTGGRLLTPNDELIAAAQPDVNNIPRLIAQHIAQASNYYRLTFDPPHATDVDEYHRLNVELSRPGLTAHTVAGYYDEPVFYDQPASQPERVTVAQLEQRLARKQGDRELASELSGLALTERLSSPRLEACMKRMPGSRSRQALTELADTAAFLPPPADEVLSEPAPDLAAQGAMLSRVADFLVRQAPRLPNFYALRTTIQYGEPMPKPRQTWKTVQPDRKLYFERTSTDRIYFESGKETVDSQKVKVRESLAQDKLETTGTFGPILILTLKAATAPGSSIEWSRWEKGVAGPAAVFRYTAEATNWRYEVGFCCLALDQGMISFRRSAAFHGEFAVDPDTGHILRLTVEADLEPRLPLKDSAILVEYGPIEMGGQTYFCPVRSVSVSRQRRLWEVDDWGLAFKVYGPFKTILNEVTFDRYHLFRSTSTILPGFVPVPQSQ